MLNTTGFNYKFTPIKKDDIPEVNRLGRANNNTKWKKVLLDFLMSENDAMLLEGTNHQKTSGLVHTASKAIKRLGFDDVLEAYQRDDQAYIVRKDED